MQYFGRQAADEVHVVGNEQKGAFVALQSHCERFHRRDVEVGGGLVHQQQVGRIDQELNEVQPALLAAAQDCGRLVDLFLAEHERTQDGPGFVFAECRCAGEHLFDDVLVGVEAVGPVLAEVAEFGIVAQVSDPLLRFYDAGDDFEQRRLAGAIGADQHCALAAFDGQIES